MGTRAWMLRTFVGCCAWILHGLNAAVAVPVATEGPLATGTVFPSTVESQAPRALVLGTAETSTAVPLPPTTTADVPTSLTDGLLRGGPRSLAFATGAELSDVATAATAASKYSPHSMAGSDAEASPSPSEPEETQVPAGDLQALTNATRSVNVSQENDAPAADAASFSTHEPLFSPGAEPNIMGATPSTSLGTTLASPQFVDVSNNISASVTREGAEGFEPVADTTSVPNFPSPSALGTQPTPRAMGYPAANSPLGLGITALPSRELDTATTGVSKEGVTLAEGFQSRASAPSLSPNPGELLATQQDEQASEVTRVTQEPSGETAPTAEERPALLEAGNAGDAPGDTLGAPDLSHPSLWSKTVSGAVGNPEETSRLAGKTEPSLETSVGPDRVEQVSPGVDLDGPYSAPSPAVSEVLAAPAEPDVKSVSSSPATAALPARTAPLPAGTAAMDEPSLLPVPWDAAAGGLPSAVDIPNGSSSSPALSSTADTPQPALDAVASTLSGAEDGAKVLANPNINTSVSPSRGESELQRMAAGTSEAAGLPSEDEPGISLNPALDDPSLASLGPASPVPEGWLGTGPGQPAAEGSEAGTAEQALGGGGSTAGDEPSLSSALVSETAAGIDQNTRSPSGPASSSVVAAASSASEIDAGTSSSPALDASSSVSLGPDGPALPGASLGLPVEEGSEAVAAEQAQGGGGSAAGPASSSSFISGSGTALGADQLPDTGSPAGPSSPIDVAAASATSETDGAGSILEAAPGPDGHSQASLAREGGPDLVAGLGAEAAGAMAETETGNLVSTSPDIDMSLPTFRPQQDPATLGELPAGEARALTDSELSPPSLLKSGAREAIALGENSLLGPAAPGSAGLDSDLGTDAGQGGLPGQPLSAPDSPHLAPGASTLPGAENRAETAASPNLGAETLSLGGSEPQGTVSDSARGAELSLTNGPGTSFNPALDASTSVSLRLDGPALPGASLGLPVEEGSEAVAAEQAQGGGGSAAGPASSSSFISGSGTALGADQLPDTGSPTGPSSPIDVAAASATSETDGAGSVLEAAPGPDGHSEASLAREGGPDLAAAPTDSPQLAPGASTLPGAENGAETAASPNLGAETLSFGGSEPQGTVSGSPGGAGLPLADRAGTSFNPALDASSSVSIRPDGPKLPGTNLGLPAEEGSEAVAAEQAQGGGGSAAGPASSSSFISGSGTALGADQLPDTGSPAGPSSPIDVAAASATSETDGAGSIPEGASGPDGLSQVSLAREGPDLAAASGGSPQLAPGAAASTLPGAENGAETAANPNLSSPVVPSLGELEPQGMVGSTSNGAGLPGTSRPGLNPALEAQSPASFSLGGPALPVPPGSPGVGPGLQGVEGSEVDTADQILGGGGSIARAEQSLSSALGISKATRMDQLPDAGSLSGPASASDVAAASSAWDSVSVNNLGGVPSAPGLSQPASGGAPASRGAQPELPPATEEAGELAEVVPGEGAFPGESQGSVAERTSVLEAFDGAARAVEHSAPSSLSVGGFSSSGTASVTMEGTGLPDASGGAGGSNTAVSGPGSSGAEGALMSAPGIQSGSGLGASEAKLSQAHVVDLPGGERGVSADNEASLDATLGAGAGGIVQAAPGVLAPLALASPQRVQTLLPPALDTGVATAGIASLLGSSLLLPAHGLGALPASLEGTGGSFGLVPKERPPSPSSIHSGSSLAAVSALLPAAKVFHGPLAGAETTLPWAPDSKMASGMLAPSGEEPPAAPVSPNVGPAVPPAAEGLSPVSRFSSPGSTSDLTAGPSTLEKGALGVASADPYGSALLLPPAHSKSPGVPSISAAAGGRGDADNPGQLSLELRGAAAGPGAAAQLPPRTATGPPAQSSMVQSSTGGSSGLAPIGVAAGNTLTKFPGAGSAGGSSPVVPQPSSSSKAIAGLSHAAAAGPAAARPSLPGTVPGQGAARGGPPATTRPPVSCSPVATVPASQASLRKVIPKPGVNGAAPLLPQGSSNVLPAPLGDPVAPAVPLPMTAAVPLYSYGTRENDREYVERRVDFNSPLFKPETGFPFGKALRDSLYFTDNGQIIFPASDKNLFPFSNPPPGGFNGREKVPMIAVFWDDADFSRGVGTTFYQEFFTLNSAKPPFVLDVEAKIQRYMKTSYSAVWTLKITWEKAPAHTARTDTRRTSTYQAVLTTDGFRSYLLILYQDGGMRWDYSQLAATNVLIGYSSGDGFYHNDDLAQRPPAAKYRPDQFRGSNTDLRGLWIYKLESRVGANYRLKCLAWTGRQQEPRVWSRDLPSCPCSLQQGQRDLRFRSARGGQLDGSRLTMLHSASPNQYGAGIRCLYDSRGQFAEGRQERYWRFSRQASPYRDQELKLHDWCCNQAGSAQLCTRYSEKRPEIGCDDGYQAPSTGWSSEEANSHSEENEDGDAK